MNCLKNLRRGLVLFLLLLTVSASAGIRPSFGVDNVAWNSDVIVVANALRTPGWFEVIETWKSDRVVPGEKIFLKQMVPFEAAGVKVVGCAYYDGPNCHPRSLSASRVVLFLKVSSADADRFIGASSFWDAGSDQSMQASLAWIENDNVFAYQQPMNPGPSMLLPLGIKEEAFHTQVSEVVEKRKEVESNIHPDDPAGNAERLSVFLRNDFSPAETFVLEHLESYKVDALPTLEKLTLDDRVIHHHGELVKLIAKLHNPSGLAFLQDQLRRDVQYWKQTGPTLPTGWWNGPDKVDVATEVMRSRYMRLISTIEGLTASHDTASMAEVKELRALWLAHPQLNDHSGLDQMVVECDRYLTQAAP